MADDRKNMVSWTKATETRKQWRCTMIFQSSDWKEPLLKSADRFSRFNTRKRLTDRALVQIEKDVFIGFYAIRKLCDAKKVTDRTRLSQWPCCYYPNMKPVTWRNNHRLDQNYDMSRLIKDRKDLEFFCGRIIHSFVFMVSVDEQGGFDGILFSSDHDKNKKLYVLTADQLIEIFQRVGNDTITQFLSQIDPVTGEEIIEAT